MPSFTYSVIQTAEKKGNTTSWQINASLTLMRQNELTMRAVGRCLALPTAHCSYLSPTVTLILPGMSSEIVKALIKD